MKRILLLLLIFSPLSLFATTYISEFPIYLHGDVRPIAAVFNSIAMVTGHDIYKTMVWLGVFSAAVVTTFALLFRADFGSATKTGVFTVGAVSILLVPVDVHIIDKRLDYGMLSPQYTEVTLGYEKVSNVPFLTALAPSIATTVSSDVIDVIEAAFQGNTINYSGMEDIGKVGFASLGFGSIFEMSNKLLKQFSIENVGDDDASKEAAMLFSKYFKDYITQCIIPASAISPLVKKAMVSPDGDIFDALSPSNLSLPASLSVSTTDKDGVPFSQSCSAFYTSSVTPNLLAIQPAVKNRIQEITKVANLSDLDASSRILLADMTSNVIGGSVEQLSIFMQNYAVTPLVEASVSNSYRNSGMSGIEIANNITGKASTAQLQGEGLGRFKWTVEILPYAMHFLFSAIVAASILSLIFLVARGFGGGFAIAKNYFVGFIQFESIRISMALVNNLVLFYAAIGAVDKMAEFGDNAVSITKIPAYLDYIATMEGIMGMLGLSAIFLIPAIVFKGDLTMAVSSIQGLSNRYIGNDVATAREKAANSAARQKTVAGIQNDEEAMAKLSKMGIDNIPKGRMPLEYYQSVMNGMKGLGQAAGAMASYDKAEAYASGNMKQSANMINQTAGYGATASFNSAANVGYQDGQVQGHMTNNTSSLRNSTNWNASDVGRGRAIEGLGKDLSSMGVSRGVSNSEVDQFAKGSENMGRIGANKTLGAGRLNLTRDDMSAIQRVSSAGIESEIGKGHAIKRNREEFGNDVYRDASKYGEMSNIHKTMAKIKTQGGIENAVQTDYKDSIIKAAQQEGSVEGDLKAYKEKAKEMGVKKIEDAIKSVAKELAEGKTSSSIATIDFANQKGGGYVELQQKIAREKISTTAATLKGSQDAGMIDNTGTLTKEGTKTVSGATELQAYSKMGNVSGMQNVMKDNPQYVESFVGQMLTAAFKESDERGAAVTKDLMKSGLLAKNKDGSLSVMPKNFAKAKAFLNANNMNSHNALIAGGMSFTGALGEDATVEAKALNSLTTGNRTETNEDVNVKNKGEQFNYDPIIDTIGSGTVGEVVKGIIAGAGFLAAADVVSGGKVRGAFSRANKKFNEMKDKLTGHARGKGDDGKMKKFNPKNPTDVEEYMENNKGAKSRIDYVLSGREPSGPKKPQSADTTNPSTNKTNAPIIADDMTSSSKDMPNDNIENPKKPNPQPKINNFATETELKAAGAMPDNPNVRTNGFLNTLRKMPFVGKVVGAATIGATIAQANGFLNTLRKMPFVGKVVGAATIGATIAQANDYFQNGEYARAAFTMTSIADLSGGSDMALAMMESQDIRQQALGNRRLSGEGASFSTQFSNVMSNIYNSGAVQSTLEMFGGGNSGPQISTAASSAIMQQSVSSPTVSMGGGDVGAQAQNLAMVLRDTNVQQEIGNAMVQSKFSTSLANDNSQQMMMETKINDVSNIVRRNLPNMDFSVNENIQEEIRKELARVKRIARRG